MAIAGRKSEGAWGYGPNGRGPHSQRGGQYDGARKAVSDFPCSTLVFMQTLHTVNPRPTCSPLLSMLALFFLFPLSSEPVSCNVIIIAASTLPHPHTGDIPLAPPQHHNYRTNLVAATTTTTSPFVGSQVPAALALTCVAGTHKPPHRRRPHCAKCTLKKPQISHSPFFSPSSLMVQDTSPRHRPVALPMACKHPPPLPPTACRPPFRCHCRHNHHHLNASTTSATSLTPSPYNQHHPTSPHRQGVQKVCWPPPSLRDPHLLTLPLCVGRSTCVAAPVAPPRCHAPPPPPAPPPLPAVLPCMLGGAGGKVHP